MVPLYVLISTLFRIIDGTNETGSLNTPLSPLRIRHNLSLITPLPSESPDTQTWFSPQQAHTDGHSPPMLRYSANNPLANSSSFDRFNRMLSNITTKSTTKSSNRTRMQRSYSMPVLSAGTNYEYNVIRNALARAELKQRRLRRIRNAAHQPIKSPKAENTIQLALTLILNQINNPQRSIRSMATSKSLDSLLLDSDTAHSGHSTPRRFPPSTARLFSHPMTPTVNISATRDIGVSPCVNSPQNESLSAVFPTTSQRLRPIQLPPPRLRSPALMSSADENSFMEATNTSLLPTQSRLTRRRTRRRNDTRRDTRSDTPRTSTMTQVNWFDTTLLAQYWWIVALIGSVIVILTVTSCTLFIKQHNIQISNMERNNEQMTRVVCTQPNNMRKKRRRNQKGYNLMQVSIERTLSEQAPCRVWMICDKIGRGRFGTVRLAIDPNDSLTSKPMFYAVKRAKFDVNKTNGSHIGGNEVLSIFHEIVILSKLNHPNIVTYFGNGVANEHICLFLEWCAIGSMADILAVRKSFSIPRIHHYLSSLLSAIDYLHMNQIYHRDIKARNILLCSNGICKLADFGSAVDCSDNGRQSDANAVPTAGTIHWMPPECFLNRNENFEALAAHDIWSLGVTVIEMITTYPPYHQLSIEVFGVLMKTSPDTYHTQVPITTDINLNLFLQTCLTIHFTERPSVKQLLQNMFIVEGPRKNDVIAINTRSNSDTPYNSDDIGILTFLRKKEIEAQKYANAIVDANLHLWLAAKLEDERQSETESSEYIVKGNKIALHALNHEQFQKMSSGKYIKDMTDV